MMAAFAAAEIIIILLRILLQVENKRRSRNNSLGHVRDSEFMNLTDKENPEFQVCHYCFYLFNFKNIMENLMRFGILVLIVRLRNKILCPGDSWRTGNLAVGSHVPP
jgi:hypothetical protein